MTLVDREPTVDHARPEPDEVELEGLAPRSLLEILKRAGKNMLAHNMPMFASALAYLSFFAIPSVLLVVVGLFTLIAGPQTITSLIQSFGHVMPAQATQLVSDSLHRLHKRPATSIARSVVGLVLAVWSTTGAMTAYMTALNVAYGADETRGFVQRRKVALLMAGGIVSAFLLDGTFLIFGPQLEKLVGSAIGAPHLVGYLWWVLQWPILVIG